MKKIVVFLFTCGCALHLYGQEVLHEILLENGRIATLYDNGKWEYKVNRVKSNSLNSNLPETPKKSTNIRRQFDEFKNTVVLRTPLLAPAVMSKYIVDGDSSYYLRLTSTGLTLNVGESGVIVLFTDGSRWESNSEVSVDSNHGSPGWTYSTFIMIGDDDLKMFSNKQISGFRLYIYDKNISNEDGYNFMKNVQDLIESN